jgi:hypothetical protein
MSCEYCSKEFNRPAGPWACPYCGQLWGVPPAPFYIVEIGNKRSGPIYANGGNRSFLKVGLTYEVCGPAKDGTPELIAACPNQEAAELVKRALESLPPAGDQLLALIRASVGKIDAIKRYRALTGADLRTAKDAVESTAERYGHKWQGY